MYAPNSLASRRKRNRRSWPNRLLAVLGIVLLVAALALGWLLLMGWSLTIAFGIIHAQLGWAQHPSYWSSVQLGFAFSAIGSAFTASLLSAIYTARR